MVMRQRKILYNDKVDNTSRRYNSYKNISHLTISPNDTKQNLINLKGEIESLKIIAEDFKTSL